MLFEIIPLGWFLFLYIVNGSVSAYLCYSLATQKKQENASAYALLGFLFGLISLVYVAGLPDMYVREKTNSLETQLSGINKKVDESISVILQNTDSSNNEIEQKCVLVKNYYPDLPFRLVQVIVEKTKPSYSNTIGDKYSIRLAINTYDDYREFVVQASISLVNSLDETTDLSKIIFSLDSVRKGNCMTFAEQIDLQENEFKHIQHAIVKIEKYIIEGQIHTVSTIDQTVFSIDAAKELKADYGIDAFVNYKLTPDYWTCVCGKRNNLSASQCLICNRLESEIKLVLSGARTADSILDRISNMSNAKEILDYFLDESKNVNNKNVEEIIEKLNNIVMIERSYGNMKKRALDVIDKVINDRDISV